MIFFGFPGLSARFGQTFDVDLLSKNRHFCWNIVCKKEQCGTFVDRRSSKTFVVSTVSYHTYFFHIVQIAMHTFMLKSVLGLELEFLTSALD